MIALPLRPAPNAGEPLDSYIERLAHENDLRYVDLVRFIRRSGEDHLAGLSALLGGQSLAGFGAPDIPKMNIPVRSFGLASTNFTHYHMRICPCCISESPWIQPLWRLKVVTACPIHRIALVDVCRRCGERVSWQTALAGVCICGQRYCASTSPVDRTELAIMRAIHDSLSGAGDFVIGELSLRMTTAEWVRFIRYTGRLIQGPTLERPGQITTLADLSVSKNLVLGTVALLQMWPDAFWRCLQRFVDASPGDASLKRVFSPLHAVIYSQLREPAFQFLRDAFETFLLEHWRGELCGRHRRFKLETIQSHKPTGLAKVSRQIGVGRGHLKRLVHDYYLPGNRFESPTDKRRELITIDASLVAQLLPDRSAYRDLKSTAKLLGVKRSRLRQIVALGILQADSRPDWDRTSHWYFRETELENFIAKIRSLSAPNPWQQQNFTTLGKVLQFWQLTPQEVQGLLNALFLGELPLRMLETSSISAMEIGIEVTRAWLQEFRQRTIPWLTPTQAAAILDVKEQVVYELISRNLLSADLVPGGRAMLKRIRQHSLEEFQKKYVSLVTLSNAQATSPRALLAKLPINPVTGPSIDGGRQYFFRREDVIAQNLLASDNH